MRSRLTCLLALVLLLTGCTAITSPIASNFGFCPSTTDTSHQFFGPPNAEDLVIFIHGLCGDAKTTWTNSETQFVFPEAIAQDFGTKNNPAYVVSFDYVSNLVDGAPSILSIAKHLKFEIDQLLSRNPYRTLRIVAHSMGGLVAREYILRLHDHAHSQLKVAGMVMLATPNHGTELSDLGQRFSGSRQIQELSHIDKNNTYLDSLNDNWNTYFKSDGHPHHMLLYAGYEELGMPLLEHIVKMSSAVSIADESLGFQKDHLSIAKPKNQDESLYRWVKAKLEESYEKTAQREGNGTIKQPADTREKAVPADIAMPPQPSPTPYPRTRLSQNPGCLAYRDSGMGDLKAGRIQKAILHFENAVELCKKMQNLLVEGFALDGLGEAHFKLEEYDRAIMYYKQALDICQKTRNMECEHSLLKSLNITYTHIGDLDNASESLKKAREIDGPLLEQTKHLALWEKTRREIQKNTPQN